MSEAALTVRAEKALGAFRLDAEFEAAPKGVTALFGASGAGKSTVLAAVAGALRPDRGRIALNGRALFDAEAGIDLPMERRAIGWVFQDARLFPHLSVAANLRYGLQRARGRALRVGIDEVAAVLGVEALLERRPRDLSGGERQRVSMGRALLSQPDLLLMDEPLSALDALRKSEILPFLERLKATFDLPILYVTHSFAEVTRLADRLVVMDGGKVVAQGPLAAVLARPDLPLLAGRSDAASALEAVVASHDPARGLTHLRVGDAELLTPSLDKPEGAAVRALVLARDVLIAVEEPRGLSARNVLAARIARLDPRADGTVLASLALSGAPDAVVLSAVTRDAVEALSLAPGLAVWAVVKSVAVEGARGGGLLSALDD
ncbi:MAG: molybdenum ABC transporter ATP-binding protein [Caulobacterales bacterium 32-69-10]|nr:MAG: molybdenum ABC transporter ATP-binding protein [Caulobacterales bacterium 32-69-10]